MYILLGIYCALMISVGVLQKLFQKSAPSDFLHLLFYNLVMALFSSGYYFICSRFNPSINSVLFLYSAILAAVVCLSGPVTILAYSSTPMPVVSLTGMAGGILLPSFIGIIFLNEPVSFRLIASLLLILISFTLPFLEKRRERKAFSFKSLYCCLLVFVLNSASTIVVKFFVLDPRVTNPTSMYFLSNLLVVLVCIILLAVYISVSRAPKKEVFNKLSHIFTFRETLYVALITVVAGIGSIIVAMILTGMHASTFSVLNSSITLIGTSLVSIFLFKEKQSPGTFIGIFMAILAIIINP